MDMSGDAAEKIVKMSLDGVEVVAKITGDTAEHFANILIKAMRDHKKSSGKASLATMLKTGNPIKVFSIRDDELKKFCQEAKKYGVLYHVLKDRDKTDGKCDIMVREEDAGKVNRIFERFSLGINNKDYIKDVVEEAMAEREQEEDTPENINATKENKEEEKSNDSKEEIKDGHEKPVADISEEEELPLEDEIKEVPEKEKPEIIFDDDFLNSLFGRKKDENTEKSYSENPTMAKTKIPGPSEPSSKEHIQEGKKSVSTEIDAVTERPSVRRELEKIEKEQKEEVHVKKEKSKSRTKHKHKSKKSKGVKDHVK